MFGRYESNEVNKRQPLCCHIFKEHGLYNVYNYSNQSFLCRYMCFYGSKSRNAIRFAINILHKSSEVVGFLGDAKYVLDELLGILVQLKRH